MTKLLIAIFIAAFAWAAHAEDLAATDAPKPRDPLASLVDVMKDDRLRNELIGELERVQSHPAAQPASDAVGSGKKSSSEGAGGSKESIFGERGLVNAVRDWLQEMGNQLPTAALGAPVDVKLDQAASQIAQRLSSSDSVHELQSFGARSVPGWLVATTIAVLSLVAVRRRIRMRISRSAPLGQVGKEVIKRGLLGLVPLAACFVIAIAWSRLLGFSELSALLFFVLTVPFAAALAVSELTACLLVLLAPAKGWRIVAYAQKRLAPLVGFIAGVAAAGSLTSVPELRSAVGPATADIASLAFDLAVPLIALVIVVARRRTVRTLIVRGHVPDDDASSWDRAIYWVGTHWHHLGILFVVLNIGARLFGAQTGSFLTQSLLSVALIVLALILSATVRRFGERRDTRIRRPYGNATRRAIFERLKAMLFRILQVTIAVSAVVFCFELWGVSLLSWMGSSGGASVMRPLLAIAVVSLTAWTLWVILDAWISNALSPQDSRQRSARVMTLLPLLRNIAFVALSILTVIAVLSNLGINVAPLIAGAGVVGLAVGFGSQQLVQDVITGLFILLEDTLAIGDVIDTGDRSGTVEALTIRTVKIRDGDGALHSIPFSMIKALKNSSRGFGVYTASVTLDVDADVERAIDVFKTVGNDVRSDTQFAGKIVAPLDVWGVDQVGLDGIVIKASIKTLPLQQYGVGREINRRVKDGLQSAGIRLATRSPLTPVSTAA
jgi:moderate conductance mechanosensitive channel